MEKYPKNNGRNFPRAKKCPLVESKNRKPCEMLKTLKIQEGPEFPRKKVTHKRVRLIRILTSNNRYEKITKTFKFLREILLELEILGIFLIKKTTTILS